MKKKKVAKIKKIKGNMEENKMNKKGNAKLIIWAVVALIIGVVIGLVITNVVTGNATKAAISKDNIVYIADFRLTPEDERWVEAYNVCCHEGKMIYNYQDKDGRAGWQCRPCTNCCIVPR